MEFLKSSGCWFTGLQNINDGLGGGVLKQLRSFIGMNVSSPVLQSAGAEKVAYETLKLIDTLFANDSMPTSWNNLEDFQEIIYRQIEESECVSQTASDYKDNYWLNML